MAAWSPGEQWYYKRRLVPFGEFFPVPAAVRDWMRLMNLPYSDFAAGSDTQRPLAAGGEALAPTICYEDAYGVEQLALARESTLLVNVTNDAWFGDSSAPHQHLDISRMRSLETGRPMLRATNDGVTALIAHDGTVLGQLPQFRPGVLTGTVEPRTGLTPYLRAGNWPVLALLWVGLVAGFRRPRARGRAQRMSHRHGKITHEGEQFPSPPRELEYLPVAPPEPGHAVPIAAGPPLGAHPAADGTRPHQRVAHGGRRRLDAGGHRHGGRSLPRGVGDAAATALDGTHGIRRIFITHDHPDHMGLSPWLQRRHDCRGVDVGRGPRARSRTTWRRSPRRSTPACAAFSRCTACPSDGGAARHPALRHDTWFDGVPALAVAPQDGDTLEVARPGVAHRRDRRPLPRAPVPARSPRAGSW